MPWPLRRSLDSHCRVEKPRPSLIEKRALPRRVVLHRPSRQGNGWGGRDRTYECRNQNPVPYHLATPQWSFSADDLIHRVPTFDLASPTATRTRSTDGARACERRVLRSLAAHAVTPAVPHVHSRTPQTRIRPIRSFAHEAKLPTAPFVLGQSRENAPSRWPGGRCVRNPRKRRSFSPTAAWVSMKAMTWVSIAVSRKCCGSKRESTEARAQANTRESTPASGRHRCRARVLIPRRQKTEHRRPAVRRLPLARFVAIATTTAD